MPQKIKQANIFGRVGTGFGKGLAEQIPKEIERARLAYGLESLAADKSNMTPFQRFARLSAIPGISPQTIQSGSELLRQEGIRNSLRGDGQDRQNLSASPETQQGRQALRDIRFGNFSPNDIQRSVVQGDKIPSGFQTRGEEAQAQPGIVTENPTLDKFKPTIPWTPQQRDAELSREWDKNPNLSFEQVSQRVADNERRYLEAPDAYRKQQDFLKDEEVKASKEFDDQLATALQKQGNQIYSDLTGSTLLNLKKSMYNDLATNPNLTTRTAAEKWIKIGKDYVETQNLLKKKANRDIYDKVSPTKKEDTLKSLLAAQPLYEKMGNQREFFNILQSKNRPPNYGINTGTGERMIQDPGSWGFDASPGAAALIAYPRSIQVKNLIKNLPKSQSVQIGKGAFGIESNTINNQKNANKFAEDLTKVISGKDSILAIAREVKDKNPNFDERAFFDYLRENQDTLTPDQKKEIVEGVADIFPNWGDVFLFPYVGRSAAHD